MLNLSTQRIGPGHWMTQNTRTGAQFEATRTANPAGPVSFWEVQRTGPKGFEQVNDFTVVRQGDGKAALYDLNRSGFQPLNEKESFQSSIVGDPHFKIEGSVNGESVSTAFDNQDVLTRTQFQGAGFALETTTVPWGSENGAAVVGSASVTTGFGKRADEVTLEAGGQLSVNGEAVSLESGESMKLNRTSSLSLNEDGSYTVSSRNGKVTNTLSAHEHEKGNYVNIHSSVDGVQTVGWLQQQA
jgi:hypothetical protein